MPLGARPNSTPFTPRWMATRETQISRVERGCTHQEQLHWPTNHRSSSRYCSIRSTQRSPCSSRGCKGRGCLLQGPCLQRWAACSHSPLTRTGLSRWWCSSSSQRWGDMGAPLWAGSLQACRSVSKTGSSQQAGRGPTRMHLQQLQQQPGPRQRRAWARCWAPATWAQAGCAAAAAPTVSRPLVLPQAQPGSLQQQGAAVMVWVAQSQRSSTRCTTQAACRGQGCLKPSLRGARGALGPPVLRSRPWLQRRWVLGSA